MIELYKLIPFDMKWGKQLRREGTTIREATEMWVHEMNAIPSGVIEKLMRIEPEKWTEVTAPVSGDEVYVFNVPKKEHMGQIVEVCTTTKNDGTVDLVYHIELDDRKEIRVGANGFEVERNGVLPMWGTMWTFGDSSDYYWLKELNGIRIMSECGFRVYENAEIGYFFGIDRAGYDFYETHWIPLYRRRGLQWHDERTEKKQFYMTEKRKAQLYKPMLDCLSVLTENSEMLVSYLRSIGFTEQEIAFEGLKIIGVGDNK